MLSFILLTTTRGPARYFFADALQQQIRFEPGQMYLVVRMVE